MGRATGWILVLLLLPAFAHGVTIDRHVAGLLSDLYAQGGFGRLPTERAAFLRIGTSGTVECVLWPRSGGFQRASFSGAVPPGTFAIAHTHPNTHREPSTVDHSLADRLGVPVLVVTRWGVSAAMPGASAPARLAEEVGRVAGSACIRSR